MENNIGVKKEEDAGRVCDFCKRPMREDVGQVECLLKKDDLQETIILNRCGKCYNPNRPLISKIWRWAVVYVLTFIVLLLTFVLPDIFNWSLSFMPIVVASFVNIFLKGTILIITYMYLSVLLGVGRKNYRSEAQKNKAIKELTDQGYCLVDTKPVVPGY